MRNIHYRTWIMETKQKIGEMRHYDLQHGEKHRKTWKMRHTHFRTWNIEKTDK